MIPKNIYINANNQNMGKQTLKFNIASRKGSGNINFDNDRNLSNSNQRNVNEIQKIIISKIKEVDQQNKKLLEISNHIMHSSSMSSSVEQLHPTIFNIQEQMKKAFNDLIQSIQQFYIDIDSKVKEIGMYLAKFQGVDTHETSKNYHQDLVFHNHNQLYNNKNQYQQILQKQSQKQSKSSQQTQNLRSISQKIQNLQKDLQQTKTNQKKLMIIIEKLIQKYQLNHETTMIKEDPFLKKRLHTVIDHVQRDDHRQTIQQNLYNQSVNQNQTFNNSNQNIKNIKEYNPFSPNAQIGYQQQPSNLNFKKAPQTQQVNKNYVYNHTIKPSIQSSHVVPVLPAQNFIKHQNQKQGTSIHYQQNNPNDYSLYQQLNIDPIPKSKGNSPNASLMMIKSNHKQQQNSTTNYQYKPHLKNDNLVDKYGTSTVSVASYAYSNPVSQESDQCFIKKLYSKQQSTSLNKLSLKNCHNNSYVGNGFQFKKKEEQQGMDTANKSHREAFLIKHLRK